MILKSLKLFNVLLPRLISIYLVVYLLTSPIFVVLSSKVFAQEAVPEQTISEEVVQTVPEVVVPIPPVVEEIVVPEVTTPPVEEPVVPIIEQEIKEEVVIPEVEKTSESVSSVKVVKDSDGTLVANIAQVSTCLDNSINPCVATDKSDYAPHEVVNMNGSGYLPNTSYLLIVSSDNSPAVRFETTIETNELGKFNVSYELDGTYRPNYSIEVRSLIGEIVAVNTFTDADSGFRSPTSNYQNGSGDSWSDATKAYGNGNGYASDNDGESHKFFNFGFNIPNGNVIDGIEVAIDAKSSDSQSCQIGVELSWDGGNNWTSQKKEYLTNSETTYILGSATDTWNGHTWEPSDFVDGKFKARVTDLDYSSHCDNEATTYLDWIRVKASYSPILLPDLTVTKENNVNGSITLGNTFNWNFTIRNNGSSTAIFGKDKEIFEDELPNTNISYLNPSNISVTKNGGTTGEIECEISNYKLKCENDSKHYNVSIPAGGSFTFKITALPSAVGTYTNPRYSSKCKVDSEYVVTESNEYNNTCEDSVVVTPQVSTVNPSLGTTCGIDIGLVVDTSSSISHTELAQMKSSLNMFVNQFDGTPTQMAIVSFDDSAVLRSGFTSNLGSLSAIINSISGSGYTNWEDALNDTRVLFPNRNEKPDLIIFASDGNPTVSNMDSNTNDNQPNQHLAPAIVQANLAKNSGIRVITLGIGNELNPANLIAISSADAYYNVDSFAVLSTALKELATELCGGTITVNKYIDSVSEQNRAQSGWSFNVAGLTRNTNSQGQTTPVEVVNTNPVSVVENSILPGYSLKSSVCRDVQGNIVGNNITNGVGNIIVHDSDIITCDFVNELDRTDLEIIKTADQDSILNGSSLTYTLTVNNLSNIDAEDVVITDTLPLGFNPTSIVPSLSGTCSDIIAPTISCEFSQIDANSFATITIVGTVETEEDEITNNANVSTSTVEIDYTNNSDSESTDITHYGSITINKVVNPSNDSGKFNLTINGTVYAHNISNGGSTGKVSVLPNTYTVGEVAGVNTDLSNYDVTYSGACNGTPTVIVSSGEDAVCTITNTRKSGTVEFVKIVEGGDAVSTDWIFNVLGVNTFTNGSFQFNTGVYTVTEQSTILGYTLTSVGGICSDLLLPNSATLTVSQQGGQCIFTNTRDTGSVKVNKLLDADGNGVFETTNPKSFTWSLDNVGQNEMGTVLNNVFTNTPSLNHIVNESTLSDYHFVGWYLNTDSEYSCTNPQGTQLPIDLTVLKNQTTELTLCNSRDTGTLKVSKQLDNNGDGTFETNNPSQFTWSYNDSSQKVMGESISNLPTGKYNLYENNVENYNFVGWFNQSGEGSCNDLDGTQLPVNVDVLKDKETEIVFCNEVQKPKLTVTKIVDGGEAQVSDFQLFVGEQQVVSGETNDFVVGQYVVSETNIDGYTGTFSGDCNLEGEVDLEPGDEKTCILTNIRDTGSLTVIKDVLDPNGNPIDDISSEFSVSLNGNEAKLISEETSVTYENLPTGQFDLVELENEDYIFDSYSLDADSEKEGAQVAVTKGQNTVLTVYNRQKFGKIVVHKEVVDSQGNYDAQSDEEFDVILSMDDESEVLGKISDNGEESLTAAFENLVPSNYTFTEVPKVGFEFVGCYLNEQENVQRLDNDTNINTVIASNEIEHWTCVNRAIDAQLALEKTNNKTGIDQIAGNTVRYTLTVQAPIQEELTLTKLAVLETEQFILNDVKVIDLAPQGFEYINGSWSAVSSVRGDLKDLLVTPQPNYSSFGTWELGTMLEGEKVTLSYEAKIANSQDAGLYKDLAWTQATDVVGERIIGSAEFGSFAGTQVTVVDPVEDGVAQVLGVSLPNTGSNSLWIALSIFSVLSGLTMLFFAGRRRKNLFVIPVIMFIGILSFLSPTNIYADSGLNLRVEQPKSIFNKKDMKLGFVALDINNREISITCEKKGPSDSGFIAFGSTIALPNGGGNGDCTLNSSLLTSNGSYQFKVNAIAGSDSASEIVNMTLDTDKPASVLNYSKNKVACTNVITFRTSGDGQTQKIQIFRSTNTTFNANSETLVYESAATPNQNIEYIDTLPNCNVDYYYAVRAVDGANNSSLFVADSIAIVIDNDTTPNDDDGNVQGVDDNDGNGNGTTDGETPKPDEDGNGEVKGEEIENDPDKTLGVTNTSWNYIIGIILAAALLWILERTGILQAIFQKIGSLRRR